MMCSLLYKRSCSYIRLFCRVAVQCKMTSSRPKSHKSFALKTLSDYCELNKPQLKHGKDLIKMLDLKEGEKVLEMGCAVGVLSSYIADIVGKTGEVLGVDLDNERIVVANAIHCKRERSNVGFLNSDSSFTFPRNYFDVHFSNYVFHWLSEEEQEIYLSTAYRCLKPGARIAINCPDKPPNIPDKAIELLSDDIKEYHSTRYKFISKEIAESLLVQSGFGILSNEHVSYEYRFSSADDFIRWFLAAIFVDENEVLWERKSILSNETNDDGTFSLVGTLYRIIGKKPNR